jgi:nitroreductase
MTVSQAIRERRTISKFRPDPVSEAVLSQILDAGIWAPNHKMTQPWRFTVVGPQTRQLLANALADAQTKELPADADALKTAKLRENARGKVLEPPVMVIVSCVLCGQKMQDEEDLAATSAAIQNMQLVAWENGIGSKWSTGKFIHLEQTPSLLQLGTEKIVGALLLGYPAEVNAAPARKPASEVTRVLP